MRTIKNLINEEKKVYIYLESEKVRQEFAKDCEKEGITFSDKVSANERKMQDVIALLPDGTICYLGFCGRMCYKNGNDSAIRINYKAYKNEEMNYIIDPKDI